MDKLTKQEEREICEALTKTFHAYEDLIEDTEGNLSKWEWYGTSISCWLCKCHVGCRNCPISVITALDGFVKFKYDCGNPDVIGSMTEMQNVLYRDNTDDIKETAKARLKDLIKVARRKGYIYK